MTKLIVSIFAKLLVSCIVFTILNYYASDLSQGRDFTLLMSFAWNFSIYAILFLIFAAIPLLIAILVAFFSKRNRAKRMDQYVNIALIIAWLVALLYFSGNIINNNYLNSRQAVNGKTKTFDRASINNVVKNYVAETKQELPKILNSYITLGAMRYEDEVVYSAYLVSAKVADRVDKEEFEEFLRNYLCSDSSAKLFRHQADYIKFQWKFVSPKGIVLANISMSGSECGT